MTPTSNGLRRSSRVLQKLNKVANFDANRVLKKVIVKKKVKDISIKETKEDKTTESKTFILSEKTQLKMAIEHIKKNDTKLAAFLDNKTIEVLEKKFQPKELNSFQALLTSIIYQQIHGKAAAAICERFLKLFDNKFPSPKEVLKKDIEDLRNAGLSARKVEYIRDLSTKFNEGIITPDRFKFMSPEEISIQLCLVKGIGQWTVDMFLMNDLHHSDILPLGDLAVRKGIINHFGLKLSNEKNQKNKIPPELLEGPKIWAPYRTLGSWLMWRIADIKTME